MRRSYAEHPSGFEFTGTANELRESYQRDISAHVIPSEFKSLDEPLEVIANRLNEDPHYLIREFLVLGAGELMRDKAKRGEIIAKDWADEDGRIDLGNWSKEGGNKMNELDLIGIKTKLLDGLRKQKIRYDSNWNPVYKK